MLIPHDLTNRGRRQQHMVPEPPIARVGDEIAYFPGLIIDEEALHMADLAVAGVNVVAGHLGQAAQVLVALGGIAKACIDAAVAAELRRRHRHGYGVAAVISAVPERVDAVIPVQAVFHLLRNGLVRPDQGALLDLVARQLHEQRARRHIGAVDGVRVDEKFPAGQPCARIDHEPAQFPGQVIEQEIAHRADLAIGGFDGEPLERQSLQQHGFILLS